MGERWLAGLPIARGPKLHFTLKRVCTKTCIPQPDRPNTLTCLNHEKCSLEASLIFLVTTDHMAAQPLGGVSPHHETVELSNFAQVLSLAKLPGASALKAFEPSL